jgi:hypothetical protein
LRESLTGASPADLADAILGSVETVKGRYAQELAERLGDPEQPIAVPSYLQHAIEWVTEPPVDEARTGS